MNKSVWFLEFQWVGKLLELSGRTEELRVFTASAETESAFESG